MATGKAMRIVRGLAGKHATVFNDRLVSGTRSFKVWGWRVKDYEQAKAALEDAGLQVRMVQRTMYSYRKAGEYLLTRLHVA